MSDQIESGRGEIYGAMAEIMRKVTAIAKSANNSLGWNTRTIDQTYNALHGLFAEHGVITLSKVLSFTRNAYELRGGGLMFETMLEIEYRFIAEDGSTNETSVLAEGMDKSDKATNKAMSYAHKNALLQAFIIPTEDQKDGDLENPGVDEQGESIVKGRHNPKKNGKANGKASSGLSKPTMSKSAIAANDKLNNAFKKAKGMSPFEASREMDKYGEWLHRENGAGQFSEEEYKYLLHRHAQAYENLPQNEEQTVGA